MTLSIPEILGNEELRREEFPVTAYKTFLAHAAVCPLPKRVAEAMAHAALNGTLDDQEEVAGYEIFSSVRQKAATLLQAQPEEVALVGPTSLGLSLVAAGLQLRRGDNIVIYFDDYPSNVYPWMALAERGVEVRLLNTRGLGRIRAIDVLGQVDESTRLVALASCHFISGWRIDLAGIGRQLRERKIWFCVDGIQTLGAFPTTVEHVDFLATDAHKWLLGPCGAGLLYVRRELQERLRPVVFGWHNVNCPDFVAQERLVLRKDARRFEAGSANLIGTMGLNACLELLLEVGVENIAAELLRKRAWLVKAAKEIGWELPLPEYPEAHASGIVTLHRAGVDMAAIHARMAKEGIVTSLRTDRTGKKYIRISPHFYNTDAELARVIEGLGDKK